MKTRLFNNGTISLHRQERSSFLSFKWFTILLMSICAAGCQKVSEDAGLIGVCPLVVSTSPADQAVNVALNSPVRAKFNEVMNGATITATSFTLKQGGNPVDGVVTYADTSAVFIPAAALAPSTLYTATVNAGVKDPQGNAMIEDYTWSFTTGIAPDITKPTVISTDPVNTATAVVLNKIVSVVFSEAMDPVSVAAGFSLVNVTAGNTAVAGLVSYSGVTASFTPNIALLPNTTYRGTVTTLAKDLPGNTLAADYSFTFVTGPLPDVLPPTVTSTVPSNLATGIAVNTLITATFSELMDPASISGISFNVKLRNVTVPGSVTYSGSTATFTPSSPLEQAGLYTATITTAAKDLSGNALAADYVWSFTTVQPIVLPVVLGTVSRFGAFGGSAGVTNQGLNTIINNGGIGTTGASTLITGFHDGLTDNVYTETGSNVGNSTGGIFTAPPAPGDGISFAIAVAAQADAVIAYNNISPASKPGGVDPGAGELGGLTIAPGIYKSAGGTFKITNGDLTLDANNDPNAVWIFQAATSLTVGIAGPTGARSVILKNGAKSSNVFWYVGSAATINGAGGGVMTGTIISSAGVTFSTAGNAVQTVLNGRAISLNASVTMVNTTINVP